MLVFFQYKIRQVTCTAIVPYVAREDNSGGDTAANEDAFQEVEDDVETQIAPIAALPNNDFCFTEEDFVEARNEINEATRHQGSCAEAWRQIRELEGEEVSIESSKDGKIVWKVVGSESITEDYFKEIRANQEQEHEIQCPAISRTDQLQEWLEDVSDRTKAFWELFPGDIDKEIDVINKTIALENKKRKERYQRVHREVTKQEYIIFHALLIGASAYAEQGDKLWSDYERGFGKKKKKRKVFVERVDYGKYMKAWRFKELKAYIPTVMEDDSKKDNDDWWRFKTRVEAWNDTRKQKLFSSFVLVFDESMSAFVPRYVFVFFFVYHK